jgi:phosphopantothenate-cysteine ligase
LDGSEKETLMKAARELMERNDCDYVLANDQAWISGDSHKGFLLGRGGECESFNNKGEIAAGIVRAALRHYSATAR